MKKIVMLAVVVAGTALPNIVPELETVTNVAPGMISCAADGCTYTYSAQLHPDAMIKGNSINTAAEQYFTIYDFNGYIEGSASVPNQDWLARVQKEGQTPSYQAIRPGYEDDSNIDNLTFVYKGVNDVGAGSELGLFSARSQFGPSTVFDFYAGQATNAKNGTLMQAMGSVRVPAPGNSGGGDTPVPEPMSLALMGIGLTTIALMRGRRSKRIE